MKKCLSGGYRREGWPQKGTACAMAKSLERTRHIGGKAGSSICAACKGQKSRKARDAGFPCHKAYPGDQVEGLVGAWGGLPRDRIRDLYNV